MVLGLILSFLICSADRLPEWRLERVLRIGAVDDADYALSQIGGIAVGPSNQLYVTQPSEFHIKVFDREGNFVRRIGREGSGPGEFRGIWDIYFAAGRLRVLDYAAGRSTTFAADGRVLETFPAPAVAVDVPFYLVPPIAVRVDGTQYLIPHSRTEVDSIPFFVMAPDGALRTIAYLRDGGLISRGRGGRLVVAHALPVNGRSLHAIDQASGDVVIIDRPLASAATTSSWRMLRVSVNGDTIVNRSFSYAPVPIPRGAAAAEMRRRVEALVKRYEEIGFPATRQNVEDAFRDGFRVPPYQAAVDTLVLGSSGEIWLRKGSFGEMWSEWVVLSADGVCRGRVRLPERTRVAFATAQHVGLIEVDDLDVNYVVVSRIVRLSRPR